MITTKLSVLFSIFVFVSGQGYDYYGTSNVRDQSRPASPPLSAPAPTAQSYYPPYGYPYNTNQRYEQRPPPNFSQSYNPNIPQSQPTVPPPVYQPPNTTPNYYWSGGYSGQSYYPQPQYSPWQASTQAPTPYVGSAPLSPTEASAGSGSTPAPELVQQQESSGHPSLPPQPEQQGPVQQLQPVQPSAKQEPAQQQKSAQASVEKQASSQESAEEPKPTQKQQSPIISAKQQELAKEQQPPQTSAQQQESAHASAEQQQPAEQKQPAQEDRPKPDQKLEEPEQQKQTQKQPVKASGEQQDSVQQPQPRSPPQFELSPQSNTEVLPTIKPIPIPSYPEQQPINPSNSHHDYIPTTPRPAPEFPPGPLSIQGHPNIHNQPIQPSQEPWSQGSWEATGYNPPPVTNPSAAPIEEPSSSTTPLEIITPVYEPQPLQPSTVPAQPVQPSIIPTPPPQPPQPTQPPQPSEIPAQPTQPLTPPPWYDTYTPQPATNPSATSIEEPGSSSSAPPEIITPMYEPQTEIPAQPAHSSEIPAQPQGTPSSYLPNPTIQAPFEATLLTNFVCDRGYGYYPIVHECDSYVQCQTNGAWKLHCPDGLHFNPHAEFPNYPCAYPSEVQCSSDDIMQKAHPTSECPRQYGFFESLDGDCTKYIMCQEGKSTEMTCPFGLVFNNVISSCDWPINVPQCNPAEFKDITCPAPPLDKNGKPSDLIYKFRYGKHCRLYLACQMGHPRLLRCDPGMSFDPKSQVCVDADNVKDCVEAR